MLVLITYDVNTMDTAGRKRLTAIAKLCVRYGQRVQNSVFECLLEPYQLKELQSKINKLKLDIELIKATCCNNCSMVMSNIIVV